MPTNRFGYSDDFVLNNGNVGINSAIPQEKLDVAGSVRGDNVRIAGVSSFTTYEGFLNANQNIVENINLEAGQGITGSLSGEVIVGTGITVTGIGSATSGQGYIDSLKVYNTFTVPSGGTLDRPSKAKPGQLYYNRDFATIEFYNGTVWRQVDNTTQRGRGVFGGGFTPSYVSTIQNITISTTGNASYFGELTLARSRAVAVGSANRMLFGGGYTGSNQSTIDYITTASQGNAISFGTLLTGTGSHGGCSSSTRGIWAGGYSPGFTNVIQYVQIDTLGNAVDFGDLARATAQMRGLSSPTRGVFAEPQYNPGSGILSNQPRMTFITIASTGNSVAFGDLTAGRRDHNACSNTIRGIFVSGATDNPTNSNTIDYITIATTGNALDFGDLIEVRRGLGACSNSIRGVFAGGSNGPAFTNTIDFISINTFGNAQDFGDLTAAIGGINAGSDSHGGLGGF